MICCFGSWPWDPQRPSRQRLSEWVFLLAKYGLTVNLAFEICDLVILGYFRLVVFAEQFQLFDLLVFLLDSGGEGVTFLFYELKFLDEEASDIRFFVMFHRNCFRER